MRRVAGADRMTIEEVVSLIRLAGMLCKEKREEVPELQAA